ncbi:MAG TPA: lysophospholipid acyltransferase family protein [Rubrivivax sp.]|nr:lysophospholipid acyltransferase family protein [Rubrivivax sp.]
MTPWLQLRSALFVAWLLFTVVPVALAVVVASWFAGGATLYRMGVFWVRLAVAGARVICGVRHRIQGMEHLPGAGEPERAVLLASKHQSAWEALAYPVLMPRPLCCVFKKELLRIPFFGWAIARLDMIHIDRARHAEAWAAVAEQGRRVMAKGTWVIMFPEGTRIPRGRQGTYKHGAARLAIETGTPIVPIAVASARCWPRKSFVLHPGVVDIRIGRPIAVRGREADELMTEVETWIEAEMRRIDPEAYR